MSHYTSAGASNSSSFLWDRSVYVSGCIIRKEAPHTGRHAPALKLMSSLSSRASVNCRADADLKLLGSRKLPREAFKDKVVWITGASQVCLVPELLKVSAQLGRRIVQSKDNIQCCSS